MTQNNMEVVAWIWRGPHGGVIASEEKPSWHSTPLVTLTSAQAEIAALAKDRDASYHKGYSARDEVVAVCRARAEAAERERDALREKMSAAMDALILARQSLEWFTERYPSDDEITAHRIHLRRVVSALQPLELKND